jgi:hypothetical protein
MITLKNLGGGVWVIDEDEQGWFVALSVEDLSRLKDLITAALQDTDFLKTKGEVE